MTERVVVTGLGCISAAGHNREQFAETVFASEAAQEETFSSVSQFTTEHFSCKIAAQVKDYQPASHFDNAQLKQLDRFAQFALLSTDEALLHADLDIDRARAARVGVVYGTSIGGQETIEQAYRQLYIDGKKRTHPFTVPKLLPSSAAGQISMKYGIQGPAFSTSSACSSSGHAIAMAALMLRSKMIDVAIAGGAEACITAGNFYAWDGLRVLSRDSCRPFSADRSGLIIGEGAGTLVLETLQHAERRGATIHAELLGMGLSSDAHSLLQPLSEGAQLAMSQALADAGCGPESIQYINAHGSGTQQNDQTETHAIHQVFADQARHLAVSSTKSTHGHALGAGAAIEGIASILALQRQQLPPTRNYRQVDERCDLDYVINEPRSSALCHVMSNSFAFGGLNTSLIFKAFAN